MHMADALLSPAVGGGMWAAAVAVTACSTRKLNKEDLFEGKKIPLMGVAGAFVFAAQMINFTIPGTGSSGHISGGLLLAAVLGPYAGFLVMSVVLAVQALLFADGGLLAYGCNLINMGFVSCFIAYPLVFRPLLTKSWGKKRLFTASLLAAGFGMPLSALFVVLETTASGVTELPFGAFAALMLPIHLLIGLAEGFITAAVLFFVHSQQPSLLERSMPDEKAGKTSKGLRRVLIGLIAAAVVCAGVLGWFASSNPDGLEWSLLKITGTTELEADGSVHETAGAIQEKTTLLPDYNWKDAADPDGVVNAGLSTSGLAGSAVVLLLAAFVGMFIRRVKKKGQ